MFLLLLFKRKRRITNYRIRDQDMLLVRNGTGNSRGSWGSESSHSDLQYRNLDAKALKNTGTHIIYVAGDDRSTLSSVHAENTGYTLASLYYPRNFTGPIKGARLRRRSKAGTQGPWVVPESKDGCSNAQGGDKVTKPGNDSHQERESLPVILCAETGRGRKNNMKVVPTPESPIPVLAATENNKSNKGGHKVKPLGSQQAGARLGRLRNPLYVPRSYER